MRIIKPEIRIVGFDDGPFIPRSKGNAIVVGVVYRGGNFLDGILKTEVEIDGLNATETLVDVVNKTKHKEQLRIIMLKGITIAGFNIIDIKRLCKETGLPVIVINRKKPNLNNIRMTLTKFRDFKKRWNLIKNAGKINVYRIENNKNLYYQFSGLVKTDVERIIELSCTRSLIPEPLRVAHLIASALIKGESGGRP